MTQAAAEMSRRGLSVVNTADLDLCGAETSDGSPCKNPAGEDGRCWLSAHQDARVAGPEPPDNLGKIARYEWNRHVEAMVQVGVLEYVRDRGGLFLLEHIAKFYEAEEICYQDVKKVGSRVQGRRGEDKTNPSASKLKSFGTDYRVSVGELRKLVSEALKLEGQADSEDEDDPWSGAWT